MSRRIITKRLQSISKVEEIDKYSDKLLKNIPAEIVAAWVAISNLINNTNNIPKITILWIVFIICFILVGFWIKKQTYKEGLPIAKTQIIVSMGAFVIWVFALGEPFTCFKFYHPIYGSIALILYTLVVPLIPNE